MAPTPIVEPSELAHTLNQNAWNSGVTVIGGLRDLIQRGVHPHVVTEVAEYSIGRQSSIAAVAMVVRASGKTDHADIRKFVIACHSGSFGRRQLAAPGTRDHAGQLNLLALENMLDLPHGVLSETGEVRRE